MSKWIPANEPPANETEVDLTVERMSDKRRYVMDAFWKDGEWRRDYTGTALVFGLRPVSWRLRRAPDGTTP